MDIHTDWSTTCAWVGTLATVLGFLWGILTTFKKGGKDDDSDDKTSKVDNKDFETRIAKLENLTNDLNLKVQKLMDQFSAVDDNLTRIENRLEKLIDMIMRLRDKS